MYHNISANVIDANSPNNESLNVVRLIVQLSQDVKRRERDRDYNICHQMHAFYWGKKTGEGDPKTWTLKLNPNPDSLD